MTLKEKYDQLEERRKKIEEKTKQYYAKIDEFRKEVGLLDIEIAESYRRYRQELKTKK